MEVGYSNTVVLRHIKQALENLLAGNVRLTEGVREVVPWRRSNHGLDEELFRPFVGVDSERTILGEEMTKGQANIPECWNFEAKLAPLIGEFLVRHSMTPLGSVRYYGSDPKGGRLFLAFFQGEGFLLKVRTVDGAADILVGSQSAPLEWDDIGWLWPHNVPQMGWYKGPGADELILLRDHLKYAYLF